MVLPNYSELEQFERFTVSSGGVTAAHNYLTSNLYDDYSDMYTKFTTILKTIDIPSVSNLRILVSRADGMVVFDSSKGTINNWGNAASRLSNENIINENHNSRISILTACLSADGIGMEQKYSSSTELTEQYLAKRIGKSSENIIGCIRYSFAA